MLRRLVLGLGGMVSGVYLRYVRFFFGRNLPGRVFFCVPVSALQGGTFFLSFCFLLWCRAGQGTVATQHTPLVSHARVNIQINTRQMHGGLEDSDSSMELTGNFCFNPQPVSDRAVAGDATAAATAAAGSGSPTPSPMPAAGAETHDEEGGKEDGRGDGNDKDDDR